MRLIKQGLNLIYFTLLTCNIIWAFYESLLFTTLLNSSEVAIANSKRIAELEDIIRRKNVTVSKLKKDLVVLEQKVCVCVYHYYSTMTLLKFISYSLLSCIIQQVRYCFCFFFLLFICGFYLFVHIYCICGLIF